MSDPQGAMSCSADLQSVPEKSLLEAKPALTGSSFEEHILPLEADLSRNAEASASGAG
jgi:hypothetical protein